MYTELTLSGKVITMGKLRESWKILQLHTLRTDQVVRMKNQSSVVGCLTHDVALYFWDGIKRQKAERDQSLTSPDMVVFINTHSKGRSLLSRKWRDLPREKLPGSIYRGRVRRFGVKKLLWSMGLCWFGVPPFWKCLPKVRQTVLGSRLSQ